MFCMVIVVGVHVCTVIVVGVHVCTVIVVGVHVLYCDNCRCTCFVL